MRQLLEDANRGLIAMNNGVCEGVALRSNRDRFVASHAALRAVLGRVIGVAPWDVAFSANEYGKPELAKQSDGLAWYFNLAHSGDRGVIAVANRRRVGVDLELITHSYEELKEVTRSFSAQERRAIERLSPVDATGAFYRCWVRKEALLKALGVGLLSNVREFSVETDEGDSWSQQIRMPLGNGPEWTLTALDDARKPPAYAAALAIEGDALPLKRREWSWAS